MMRGGWGDTHRRGLGGAVRGGSTLACKSDDVRQVDGGSMVRGCSGHCARQELWGVGFERLAGNGAGP